MEPGEVAALVGPNGAGKTTLLRILLGFKQPDRGQCAVAGLSPKEYRRRRGVGYLPESLAFPRVWTCRDFLGRSADLSAEPSQRRAVFARSVARSGLDAAALDKSARLCSKGMRRRLGLAHALAAEPALVVLDEPFSGLDLQARAALAGGSAGGPGARRRRAVRESRDGRSATVGRPRLHSGGWADAARARAFRRSRGRLGRFGGRTHARRPVTDRLLPAPKRLALVARENARGFAALVAFAAALYGLYAMIEDAMKSWMDTAPVLLAVFAPFVVVGSFRQRMAGGAALWLSRPVDPLRFHFARFLEVASVAVASAALFRCAAVAVGLAGGWEPEAHPLLPLPTDALRAVAIAAVGFGLSCLVGRARQAGRLRLFRALRGRGLSDASGRRG